MDHAFFY
jgi:hypothetical protein